MSNLRSKKIQDFIVFNIEQHPSDIVGLTSKEFGISPAAVHKHLKKLYENKIISHNNKATKARLYSLVNNNFSYSYILDGNISEDAAWRADIEKHLSNLDKNIKDIWHYSFTEIFNNAIDHSRGSLADVLIMQNAVMTTIKISDNGVGVFKNIKDKLNLADEREAVVELTKGKITTDPSKHSGEGIFFTSRMVDVFGIFSGEVELFHHAGDNKDWVFKIGKNENPVHGSSIWMRLSNKAIREVKEVFDEYSSGAEYGFNNTVIPVKLSEYEGTQLVSRSQAKRLLANLDKFKVIVLDFNNVENIGQAFADEIFRVFASANPQIDLQATNTNTNVQNMINRALSGVPASLHKQT